MLKTKQNRSKIFILVKLILFIGVLFVIYWQIRNFDGNAWKNFELQAPIALVFAIILMIPNIWLAFLKWRVTTNVVIRHSDSKTVVQSFFAGIVTGMLTPNMAGNFIGRFYYFEKKYRTNIILFTLLSNFAQFLASVTFGWIAILLIGDLYIFNNDGLILTWLGFAVILAYILYFFIDNLLQRFKRKHSFQVFRDTLLLNRTYRLKILGLSYLRFSVFTLQFALILGSFGEEISLNSVLAIWQVYLLTMLIPSLFLGKIGVRESVALFVLTSVGMNPVAVLLTSLLIWFINSITPAIVGFVVCKKRTAHV